MSTVSSGADFPDITVPATTTATTGSFRNLATVANVNENPFNNYGNNNSDPANVTVTTSGPACVPGAVTGAQTAPVTASTAGLCPAGQTVNGFAATTAGTVTTYNWGCNGSAVGGLCTASYNTSGPACVPGAVTGAQTAPVTASTAGLCPAGQTVNGFAASTVGTVTTYVWGC